MKPIFTRTVMLLIGLAMLPSCTLKYQQLLREKDMKIKDLYAQVAELTATNQDLEARERGAQQRVADLEQRLQNRPVAMPASAPTGLEALKKELPGVDVRLRGNRLSLGINNTVTFSSGSTRLKSSSSSVLKSVARVLQREFPGRRVIVEGHTDTDPIKRTKNRFRNNRHLSLERADAVANYLVKSCGISEAAVVVAGYGEHDPLSNGSGRSAKARNRRVEIVVGDPL